MSGVPIAQLSLPQSVRMVDSNYGKRQINSRDLSKKNMLDPILILGGPDDQKYPPKTMVRFSKGAPVLVTGDVTGDVYVYRLNSNTFIYAVE